MQTRWVERFAALDTMQALAEAVVAALMELCQADGASVYARDGGVLLRLAAVGLGEELDLASRALTAEDGVLAMELAAGQGFAIDDADPTPLSELAQAQGIGFVIPMTLGVRSPVGLVFTNWSATPEDAVRDRARRLVLFASIVADRLSAERDARRCQAFLDVVLENIDEGVVIASPEGRYAVYSAGLERLSGWSREEVEREGWPNLAYPDPEYRAQVMASIRAGFVSGGYDTAWTLTRADGTRRGVRVSSRVVNVPGEAPQYMGMFWDDQAAVDARRERQRDEGLLALGRYTSALAHDVNNVLGLMLGHAELIGARRGLPDDVRDRARVIVDAARRGGELTDRALALAYPEAARPVALDLADEISPVVALLDARRPPGVDIRIELAPGLPPVDADPGALHQVLLNLLTNALDAVGEVGTIVVQAGEALAPEAASWRSEELEPGAPMIAIRVKDDGPGFTETALERLFDPTYSEKPYGRGVGLSVVRAMARAHRGAILAENDGGAVVTLFLHRSQRALLQRNIGRGFRMRGDERLWILDDERALLEYVDLTLGARGYRTQTFHSGEELLAASAHGPPDLLLLNVVLPGWHGRELLDELRRRGLTAPVLWISGFNPEAAGLGAEEASCFLRKPFTGTELSLKVREVLDRRI
ncbi:MAG: response regulator [Alphaproteobacteria bacterium]|nr:response regulator [Alphaproteobacteria bacterium]